MVPSDSGGFPRGSERFRAVPSGSGGVLRGVPSGAEWLRRGSVGFCGGSVWFRWVPLGSVWFCAPRIRPGDAFAAAAAGGSDAFPAVLGRFWRFCRSRCRFGVGSDGSNAGSAAPGAAFGSVPLVPAQFCCSCCCFGVKSFGSGSGSAAPGAALRSVPLVPVLVLPLPVPFWGRFRRSWRGAAVL